MAAPIGFGNWQLALDEISNTCANKHAKLMSSFIKLESNDERVSFIFREHLVRDVGWLQDYFAGCENWHGKSNVEATFWKAKGNKFFQQRKFALAVEAYTQSVLNAVPSEGNDLALGLGNRSAALFHLTHYKSCITDISRAVACDFPSTSVHKLYARKTQAFIKLGQREEAEASLQVLKDFVNSSSFSLEGSKKGDFLKEIDAMSQQIQNIKCVDKCCLHNDPVSTCAPKVYGKLNSIISQASDSVYMKYTVDKGRHVVATSSIPRGSTLMVERPYAGVLLPDHYDTHCHHCFSTLPLNCVGCERCTSVRFCNETCRDTSWSQYHSTECAYLDLLQSVGIAHLSLRVVLCAGLTFLKDFLSNESKRRLSPDPSSLGVNSGGKYDRGYLTVFHLLTHEDKTESVDMLQYSLTAALLLVTLAHAGFFSTPDYAGDHVKFDLPKALLNGVTKLPVEMVQVGGVLLRHILQLVCNAHAITSIQDTDSERDEWSVVSGTEQTRIATAIYPTASLMNHSCDPTIVSSFLGDTLVVRTVKDVREGEEIFNCYGPHSCRMGKEERQAVLEAQYHFTCGCPACEGKTVDNRRFGAFRCDRCGGVLYDGSCLECRRVVDAETLAMLQSRSADCQKLFDNALQLMNAHQYEAALAMFERCRDERKEILYRDHRDLAVVQDALARCHASLGDFCSSADELIPSVKFASQLYGSTSPEYAHELHKLAEILFNAGRIYECAGVCKTCLDFLPDLYPEGHQFIREVTQLHKEALNALVPKVEKQS